MRGAWRQGFVFGTINGALPFTLIAWGETHIDSGVAAVANASVPIFVALLAMRFNPGERSTGLRLVGIVVGLAGVAVLAGINPAGGAWGVIGTLAVVLASVSYAAGGLYGQRAVGHLPGPVLATSSLLYGALVLLPLAAVQHPTHMPDWKPVASLTGKEAVFGQNVTKGTRLAIEETNAAGGVLGRKLELVTEDDQSKPGESALRTPSK